jgi:protein-tyrosine phosphatase
MPIPDGGTPTVEEMARILDTIDAALEETYIVYIHCWGGSDGPERRPAVAWSGTG